MKTTDTELRRRWEATATDDGESRKEIRRLWQRQLDRKRSFEMTDDAHRTEAEWIVRDLAALHDYPILTDVSPQHIGGNWDLNTWVLTVRDNCDPSEPDVFRRLIRKIDKELGELDCISTDDDSPKTTERVSWLLMTNVWDGPD